MTPGYFLIDTGSMYNILNPAIMDWIGEDCITDETHDIIAINEKSEKCQLANLEISIGEYTGTEKFCMTKSNTLSKYFGEIRIVGILGADFLVKHGLLLDLECSCLRSSTEGDVDVVNMSYTFPMSYGLKIYGIPLVGIAKGDQLFMFVADSGCDQSLATKYVIENGCMNYQYTSERSSVVDAYDIYDVSIARVQHQLASYNIEKGEFTMIESDDSFVVLSDRDCIRESDDEHIPPISGLLSAGYMLGHKWILDFNRQVIYSRVA